MSLNYRGHERREAFRMDDKAELQLDLVTNAELAAASIQAKASFMHPKKYIQALKALDHEMSQTLGALREQYPGLYLYLHLLDKKINHLADAFKYLAEINDSSTPLKWVNLSENGMAFQYPEALKKEQGVKIQMVLHPSYLDVEAYAKVIYTTPIKDSEKLFRVGVKFEHIQPSDQQLIAKHLIELQANLKRIQNQEFNRYRNQF